MHTLSSAVLVLLTCAVTVAQETTPAAPTYGWKHSLVSQLTLTQTGYTNWVQGGENALSYTASADGKEIDDLPTSNWATSYRFAFGQARLGSGGLRKTDDQINLESIFIYKVDTVVNPYASFTMKTQFARGYTYGPGDTVTPVSDFFDPAYLTQGIGAAYQPIDQVKTRLGVALREILTNNYPSFSDDPATPEIEKRKIEGGIQLGVEVNWGFYENMVYTSKLDVFDAFKALGVAIVHWDNTLAMKVNKIISVNASLNVINEAPISPRTQLRETIGLVIGYNVF